MIQLDIQEYMKIAAANGYKVFRQDGRSYNLNIVGYRNRFGRADYFDDTIAVYYEVDCAWVAKFYPATTKPGLPYLFKPVNQKGAAILVPGQYTSAYQIGLHRQKYSALVQVKPVAVYRDNDQDDVYDLSERTMEAGLFGINIHRASFGARVVGVDSAGCQVIQYYNDFKDFMDLCSKGSSYWGNSFTYTLVEI